MKSKIAERKEHPNKGLRYLTEYNVRTIRALLTGKWLKGSISETKAEEISKELGVNSPQAALRKFEDMGIIIGYVPVLSEEGRKVLEAMEIMYGLKAKDNGQSALMELVQ